MNRRRLKKAKRGLMLQGEEAQAIVDTMMTMCGQHGIPVDFPYQLTEILENLLTSKAGGVAIAKAAGNGGAREGVLERLRGGVPIPVPAARRIVETVPATEADPFNVGSEVVRDVFADELEEEEEEIPSMEEMEAMIKEKQDRMVQRVATQGVRYKFGAGPAQGKRLVAEGDDAPKDQRMPFTDDADGFEEDEGVTGGEGQAQTSKPSAPKTGGPINRKTGMSLEQSREIIARATGKAPSPPPGGAMNVLKR